jgi:hypothetical protein
MDSKQNKAKYTKTRLLYAALFVVMIMLISYGSWYVSSHRFQSNQKREAPEVTIDQPKTSEATIEAAPAEEAPVAVSTIPKSAEIKMQFASQAPYGNWDQPYQDACEEASIIIDRYYLDKLNLTKDIMNEQILAMVDWQMKNWGGHSDLPSEKTLELAQNFYGINGQVIYNYDVDLIKQKIADGIPVLIPADGRKLNNPNFKNGGPEYHMLVIKGYDSKNFITNDPGTRKGEGYVYPYDIILNSIKNPSGGEKSVFVLYK